MRRFVVGLFVFCLGMAAQAQHSLGYPQMVVFGDSFSDEVNTYRATFSSSTGVDGNGDPITITDAYPSLQYGYADGEFTNGSGTGFTTSYANVWHYQLHALLPGVPLATQPIDSYVTGGPSNDYAWGGATTGSGTEAVTYAGHLTATVHNMNQQITDYLNAGYTPNATTLYVLFGGINDLLADSSQAGATAAAANVTADAKRLIDLGAVNVLVANVPGVSSNTSSPIDVAAGQFSVQLAQDLAALQAAYVLAGKTVKLTTLDVNTLYANMIANPAKYGFTDVTTKAIGLSSNGYYTQNLDHYLNWDGTNPTTAGHHQIALAACTALTGTVTTLATSAATATVGQPATLTATVSTSGTYGPKSAATPTGTVTFYYPQTILTTTTEVALGTVTLGANGLATLTTAALPPGTYSVYAVYNGDSNFATGCNSNAVAQTVAAAASSFDFSFSPTAAYLGMEEGVALNITTTPIGGFTGAVTFNCGTLPTFFACSFYSNQTVQVGGSTMYVTQLDITSGTPTKLGLMRPPLPGWGEAVFAGLLCTPLLVFGTRRRRIAPLLMVLCMALLAGIGCAEGSAPGSSSSGNSDPGYGTTHGPGITYAAPGTYAIPITATSGGVSVTHTYYVYIADTFDIGVTP